LETPGIPFLCQWDLKPEDEPPAAVCRAAGVAVPALGWAPRSCGIACVAMVLGFWGRDARMSGLLREALELGAWDGERNWRHSLLVALLVRDGLTAWRRNWRLLDGREREYLDGRIADARTAVELDRVRCQMLDEGLHTLASVAGSGLPVIVSVYRPAWDRRSPGHLVVLAGWEGERVQYHDPAERDGRNRTISVADFRRRWKGTAIFATAQGARDPATAPGVAASGTAHTIAGLAISPRID
jgi:Papain-like cysteine protease AvrRpt2